jgi:hypothetical protein
LLVVVQFMCLMSVSPRHQGPRSPPQVPMLIGCAFVDLPPHSVHRVRSLRRAFWGGTT